MGHADQAALANGSYENLMELSLNRIDEFLADLDNAKDDQELRRLFQTYSAEYDLNVPEDPFSELYKNQQFRLYETLSGKAYTPENEVTKFDVEENAVRPFPYHHRSSELVGDQLMAIGFLIKAMNLPAGASVLEFGPGWGNTTLTLAKMGYHVTAVDIEQNFVDLISRRAAMESLEVNAIRGDFSLIESIQKRFDAILFFECFHHSQDHLRIIQNFDRALTPGGIVCLASEPILDEFPIPWGLRMDGESLWAIRKNGWLELGFQKSYFDEALSRSGFVAVEHVGVDGPWSKLLIARRKSEMGMDLKFAPGGLSTSVGDLGPAGVRLQGDEFGYVAYGPYKRLRRGSWRVELELDPNDAPKGFVTVDVVDEGGQSAILRPTNVDISSGSRGLGIKFQAEKDLQKFEVRVLTTQSAKGTISGIKLTYL